MIKSFLFLLLGLFNLRARDIPYNPMFFAYAIVSNDGNHTIYIDPGRMTDNLTRHLNGVQIKDYNQITNDISQFSTKNKKIWISPMSSYAIYNAVTNKNMLVNNKASPVRSLKAVKNPTEIRRAKECQVKLVQH
jgi:Xaa-Pro aminopeptidase